ncbi:hypothetical protein PVNG_05969 [Plasmodium vivax North Korean]|uniref:Variable surface protein Vir7-like protein n=1 Tax=Plasmodium vivax North Korean TaxID=1035514 RepID=A0A0J9WF12_PLAVI|nr:hypothetical protein PVNG_05969 [Plasmodium vivax North Korean]
MFYRGAKSILDNYNVHQNISHKILKGLCYAYGNNFREHPVNDICDFLYYWLGGILYDNIIPSIRFDSVMPYLFVILRIRNGIKCTAPTYYNISEGENFKNIKLLFDYSKDYDIYDEQITNNNLPCNKNYNEYLQKYVATYKEYEGKCKNVRTSSGYCKAFNEYFHEKNPERLSNLTCNVQNSEPVAERTFGKTKDMQEQHLPAQGMEGKSVTLSEGFQGENEQVAEDGVSSVHPSSQGTSDLINISGPADVPSISTTKTIATTASVAGILVPPFLVYNVISITIVKLIVLFYI